MKLKDFAMEILCIIFILLNNSQKGYGSSLNCCFEVLRNHSVSYHLNEPPGDSCIPTWSENKSVVVDEQGNVDETKVLYLEPQKLILKGNIDEKNKQVRYRKDCLLTGFAYTAECLGPCDTLGMPRTTPVSETILTTQVRDRGIIIGGTTSTISVILIAILIIIIIITYICVRRKPWQALNITSRYTRQAQMNEMQTV